MSKSLGPRLTRPLLSFLKADPPLNGGRALLLSTVDADGWPRLAMLSSWEVFAVSDRRIRVATYASSMTTKNMRRNGQAALTLFVSGKTYYLRCSAKQFKGRASSDPENSVFDFKVEDVLEDSIPGLEVRGVLYDGQNLVEDHRKLHGELKNGA